MASNADAGRLPASRSSQQHPAEVEGRHRNQGAAADAAHIVADLSEDNAKLKREAEELRARLDEAEAAAKMRREAAEMK
jgi:regulator of replication initiation timing